MDDEDGKMVTLPSGCSVPETRLCQVCDQMKPTLEMEWHSSHDHPVSLACPECRAEMDTWKPLPKVRECDRADSVKVKLGSKKHSKTLEQMYIERKRKERAEPFTVTLDAGVTLDDPSGDSNEVSETVGDTAVDNP